jgi:hypothetical protein
MCLGGAGIVVESVELTKGGPRRGHRLFHAPELMVHPISFQAKLAFGCHAVVERCGERYSPNLGFVELTRQINTRWWLGKKPIKRHVPWAVSGQEAPYVARFKPKLLGMNSSKLKIPIMPRQAERCDGKLAAMEGVCHFHVSSPNRHPRRN